MQLCDIKSESDESLCIGSLVFGSSFIQIDSKHYIDVNDNIPALQTWHTNHKHYMNTQVPILSEKNLMCDSLGEKIKAEFFEDVMGFLPLENSMLQLLRNDILLYGKLSFYEKGFIYTDTRLGPFVVLNCHIAGIMFHMSEEQNWIEFQMTEAGKNLLPA